MAAKANYFDQPQVGAIEFGDGTRGFIDTSENFHPYCCEGKGKCRHCDGIRNEHHNPDQCALCQEVAL